MSKHIGQTRGHAVYVEGDGVYVTIELAAETLPPSGARTLAALLIKAAAEVERMRAERATLLQEVDTALSDALEPHYPTDLSGNPRFDRGG